MKKTEQNPEQPNQLHVGILCGGPSGERGISLNSARSLLDHLGSLGCKLSCFYLSPTGDFYALENSHMYSNTPLDFDFKLSDIAQKLEKADLKAAWTGLDILFPAIHGTMGEDGGVQSLCEGWGVAYAGSPPSACELCFDKQASHEKLKELGFPTVPYLALTKNKASAATLATQIDEFVSSLKSSPFSLVENRFIVKPATGGSSLDVLQASSKEQIADHSRYILDEANYEKAIIEPFCRGVEFTVILLETADGVKAMPPSEIATSYEGGEIFDYRKKYLPNTQVHYHCPPRFEEKIVRDICQQAESIFTQFGMRDFARFDGWLLADGSIVFSDLNPISGMEQNSFLFQQPAYLGLSHSDTLSCILQSATGRNEILWEPARRKNGTQKTELPVLFGGVTAERQVSLMSGTNAWLKLRGSSIYRPTPYLLKDDSTLVQIPYAFCLAHTVEEIKAAIASYPQISARLSWFAQNLLPIFKGMGITSKDTAFHIPIEHTLMDFVSGQSFVFSGLHGGIGENGTLQAALEKKDIRFNGPGSVASQICMDKFTSSQALEGLEGNGIYTIHKYSLSIPDEIADLDSFASSVWQRASESIGSRTLIAKPQDEGCSAGIVKLESEQQLKTYLMFLDNGLHAIPTGALGNGSPIDMPPTRMKKLLLEEFIETDRVWAEGKNLQWEKKTGWVEITVGVLERGGVLASLTPSMSIASGDVLSVEEKFQGGTGINLTPPPAPYIAPEAVEKVKKSNVIIAQKLGLSSYSRTDLFMHCQSGDVKFIEVNTTPALTPSTVLYHQALAEEPPLPPRQFLELLISEAKK